MLNLNSSNRLEAKGEDYLNCVCTLVWYPVVEVRSHARGLSALTSVFSAPTSLFDRSTSQPVDSKHGIKSAQEGYSPSLLPKPVMKIRWFASQNAYFRVLANQFLYLRAFRCESLYAMYTETAASGIVSAEQTVVLYHCA